MKQTTTPIDLTYTARPVAQLKDVQRVIARLNRKVEAAGIPESTLTVTASEPYEKTFTLNGGIRVIRPVLDITVTGELTCVDGIDIVAYGRVAETPDGKRFIDCTFSHLVDESFLNSGSFLFAKQHALDNICDHCGRRPRTRYIFIRDNETGLVSTYGANCLQHYVSRNAAKVTSDIFAAIATLDDEMTQDDFESDSYFGEPHAHPDRAFDWGYVIRWAKILSDAFGWVSSTMKAEAESNRQYGLPVNPDHLISTRDRWNDMLDAFAMRDNAKRYAEDRDAGLLAELEEDGRCSNQDLFRFEERKRVAREQAFDEETDNIMNRFGAGSLDSTTIAAETEAKIREWLTGLDTTGNEYLSTLKHQMTEGFVSRRRIGYTLSTVAAYERAMRDAQRAQEEAVNPSEYLGTVGDKITFTGNVVLVKEISSDFGLTNLIKVSADGNIVTMFTAAKWSWDVAEGDTVTITATVKRHEEYRETKQTMVNRPKLNTKKEV